MEKLTIRINLENAAFAEEPMSEVGRILRKYAKKIEDDGDPDTVLLDINGNIVGFATLETH